MNGMSLLDVLRGVMLDPAEQAVYDADPGAYLGQYGYEDVDPADLSEAFGLVADTLPADQAMSAWTGESGPQSPLLGADTTDFDVGGPDDTSADLVDPVGDDALDTEDDTDTDDGPDGSDDSDDGGDDFAESLSFGVGEDDGGAGDGLDSADTDVDDLGLFGTAAPDDATDGGALGTDTADDLDAAALDDTDFDDFTTGFDDPTADADPGHDGRGELDDTDDLAEIDGLGPLGDGPEDLDIGSF